MPAGIKELEPVAGWPATEASLVFRDRVADDDVAPSSSGCSTRGGAVRVGLTTASEFGGLNVSVTKLNGVTHNPWQHGRTTGGSSAGSAAAVAGGLVTLATGGDGGGSIRIPAGYTGLLGMKGTFGRIPRAPHAFSRPNTVVLGNLARSVRDAARFYDVCAGYDPADPSSLPAPGGWEAGLGTHDLAGRPGRGAPDARRRHRRRARGRGARARGRQGAHRRDRAWSRSTCDLELPNLAAQWMMGNLSTLLAELGDRWPRCAPTLTDEVAFGLYLSQSLYNLRTAAVAEELRVAGERGDGRRVRPGRLRSSRRRTRTSRSRPTPRRATRRSGFVDCALSGPVGRYAVRGALGVRARRRVGVPEPARRRSSSSRRGASPTS